MIISTVSCSSLWHCTVRGSCGGGRAGDTGADEDELAASPLRARLPLYISTGHLSCLAGVWNLVFVESLLILSESCRQVFPSSLLTVPAFPPATRSTKARRRSGQGSADTVESPYPTLYTADKITYYTQWTLAKWAVPCKGSYILAMCKNRVSVGRWSPSGCKGFHIFTQIWYATSILSMWVVPCLVPLIPRLFLGQHLQIHSDPALNMVF